jgi:hypothetical protein
MVILIRTSVYIHTPYNEDNVIGIPLEDYDKFHTKLLLVLPSKYNIFDDNFYISYIHTVH